MARLKAGLTLGLAGSVAIGAAALAQPLPAPAPHATPANLPPVAERDVVLKEFTFHDGARLPEIRMHVRTLGSPHRDAAGQIDNAVLILHGTGGTGATFLRPIFAGELFGPGQPLDTGHFFIVIPDSLGHGGSSKPSDGLRMRFPPYNYSDMVEAERRMLAQGFGVTRLRLILGTSMGCMHAFVWGTEHPQAARALMPLACLPVELAGRNRMWRKMAIDAIEADPAWRQGDYTTPPTMGLRGAAMLLTIAGTAPVRLQHDLPTRAATEDYLKGRVEAAARVDANDLIYQIDASRDYDPEPKLGRITAPVMWLNSADDFINPPGLGIAERTVSLMPNARYRLIPESAETHGHGTHTYATFWKADLIELLRRSE
jgi:homoserine O-acetyltransferase